jgi:GNAT superfamily N-acetyltransferase
MAVVLHPIGRDQLLEYASVPSIVHVRSVLVMGDEDAQTSERSLSEQPIVRHYVKDYDAYSDGGPLDWPRRFDISRWGLWVARDDGTVLGGGAVAWDTSAINLLEGRRDLAVLWDIRVRESNQREGIGADLFREAAQWAKSMGCRALKIETQNVNVGACRFYAKMGCRLTHVDSEAYCHEPKAAGEIMLVWQLEL